MKIKDNIFKIYISDINIALISLSFIFLLRCNFVQTEINNKTDKNEGLFFVESIYKSLKMNRGNDVILSTAVGEKKKLTDLLNRKDLRMGVVKEFNVETVETHRLVKNGMKTVNYIVKVKVIYEKGNSDEVFGLVKYGKSGIKINGYNVYSDLML